MQKKNNLKTISILFYVACGLCILMAIVNLVAVFKDVNSYITKLANAYFGENGSLTSMIDSYVANGIFTEDEAKNLMNSLLKMTLYETIIFSIINLVLATLIIVLVIKLKPSIDEPKQLLLNHAKITKPIKTLAIFLTIFEVFTSETFPLDPIFILLIVTIVKFNKELKEASEIAKLNNAYRSKGIKIDAYGNIINEAPVETPIVTPIIKEEKTDLSSYDSNQVNNFYYEEPKKKQTSEDMEKIYLALASLEKKYKNNEISEQEYLEEKNILLNKIN